jgi:hypothetical protein
VEAVNDSLKAEVRIPCPINELYKSASISKKELQGVEDEANEKQIRRDDGTRKSKRKRGSSERPRMLIY